MILLIGLQEVTFDELLGKLHRKIVLVHDVNESFDSLSITEEHIDLESLKVYRLDLFPSLNGLLLISSDGF